MSNKNDLQPPSAPSPLEGQGPSSAPRRAGGEPPGQLRGQPQVPHKTVRRRLAEVLRKVGLLGMAEAVERWRAVRAQAADNVAYQAAHPDFPCPPPAFLYEAHSHASFALYADTGRRACAALSALVDNDLEASAGEARAGAEGPRILDWGCGPARVARWWAQERPDAQVSACDPWPDAIAWISKALPHIDAHRITSEPPTPFADVSFDLAYGISIVTHLSAPGRAAWMAELERLVRPGGLIALSLHGETAAQHFTDAERAAWDAGRPVERAAVREGSRLYATYLPPQHVRGELLANFDIIVHDTQSPIGGGQDLWVARRR